MIDPNKAQNRLSRKKLKPNQYYNLEQYFNSSRYKGLHGITDKDGKPKVYDDENLQKYLIEQKTKSLKVKEEKDSQKALNRKIADLTSDKQLKKIQTKERLSELQNDPDAVFDMLEKAKSDFSEAHSALIKSGYIPGMNPKTQKDGEYLSAFNKRKLAMRKLKNKSKLANAISGQDEFMNTINFIDEVVGDDNKEMDPLEKDVKQYSREKKSRELQTSIKKDALMRKAGSFSTRPRTPDQIPEPKLPKLEMTEEEALKILSRK